jgi:hypothetical protein
VASGVPGGDEVERPGDAAMGMAAAGCPFGVENLVVVRVRASVEIRAG